MKTWYVHLYRKYSLRRFFVSYSIFMLSMIKWNRVDDVSFYETLIISYFKYSRLYRYIDFFCKSIKFQLYVFNTSIESIWRLDSSLYIKRILIMFRSQMIKLLSPFLNIRSCSNSSSYKHLSRIFIPFEFSIRTYTSHPLFPWLNTPIVLPRRRQMNTKSWMCWILVFVKFEVLLDAI